MKDINYNILEQLNKIDNISENDKLCCTEILNVILDEEINSHQKNKIKVKQILSKYNDIVDGGM